MISTNTHALCAMILCCADIVQYKYSTVDYITCILHITVQMYQYMGLSCNCPWILYTVYTSFVISLLRFLIYNNAFLKRIQVSTHQLKITSIMIFHRQVSAITVVMVVKLNTGASDAKCSYHMDLYRLCMVSSAIWKQKTCTSEFSETNKIVRGQRTS
jgi:hypothetical protein